MCIGCSTAGVYEPLGLCPTCSVHTRIEFSAGLRRLSDYLAAWAAFADWCRLRDGVPD